jgi:hypothetical protein
MNEPGSGVKETTETRGPKRSKVNGGGKGILHLQKGTRYKIMNREKIVRGFKLQVSYEV